MASFSPPPKYLIDLLLAWYDDQARTLPWRIKGENHHDPYAVWVSEIMLQQTTVATVKDYFIRFMNVFPTVFDLANAPLEDVLVVWQGLGYYSRARNLHKAARKLVQDFQGIFPSETAVLQTLPGIGPYTAAAIAAIAFNTPCLPVDGNIARVFARMRAIETPLPSLLSEVRTEIKAFVGHGRHHGDVAQALMDLGATVCTPTSPSCNICPWNADCQSARKNTTDQYPTPTIKKKKPLKFAHAYLIQTPSGRLWLRKRPDTGLLAGLMEVPMSDWLEDETLLVQTPPIGGAWIKAPSVIKHVFTHFDLYVQLWTITIDESSLPIEGFWACQSTLPQLALPTLIKKVIKNTQPLSDKS